MFDKSYRKVISWLSVIAVISTIIVVPTFADENYMMTEGFENGIGSWTSTNGTISLETINIHSGDKTAAVAMENGKADAYIRSEKIDFEKDSFYEITGWAASDDNTNSFGAGFGTESADIITYTNTLKGGRQQITNKTDEFYNGALSSGVTKTQWKQYKYILYSKADVSTELLFIARRTYGTVNTARTIYFDDITVSKLNKSIVEKIPTAIELPDSGNVTTRLEHNIYFNGNNMRSSTIQFRLDDNIDGVSLVNDNMTGSAASLTVESTVRVPSINVTAYVKGAVEAADIVLKNYNIPVKTTMAILPEAHDVTISGVGNRLAASYYYVDLNDDEENGTTIAWYRADDETSAGILIENEDENEYTITGNDVNKYVYAVVTPKNDIESGNAVASNRFFVVTSELVNITIIGDCFIGNSLTVQFDKEISGDVTYQWYRNDVPIANANSSTYVLVEEDGKQRISVRAVLQGGIEVNSEYIIAANELIDLILVSGQSNSCNYLNTLTGPYTQPTCTSNNVLAFDGKEIIQAVDWKNSENVTAILGVTFPLGVRWNELNNDKKVVLLNTGVGGKDPGFFTEGRKGYDDTKAVYQAALKAVSDAGYKVDKKITFWLQGEGNSCDTPEQYEDIFDTMVNQWEAEDMCGVQDLFAIILNRAWFISGVHGLPSDRYLTAPRSVFYASDFNREDNRELIGVVTDEWISDETVSDYFIDKYHTNSEFKEKFGYDMPTTMAQMVELNSGWWRGHYNMRGFHEVGTDAAEKAYRFFTTSENATEIKVLDSTGSELAQTDIIKLQGNRTNVAAYLYPIASKGETITFDNNAYFSYDGSTGVLTQIANAPTSIQEIIFRSGDLTKTVRVQALTDGDYIEYKWSLDATDDIITDYWKFADTKNNYLVSSCTSVDGKLTADNSTASASRVVAPIVLPHDKAWKIRINGRMNDTAFYTDNNNNYGINPIASFLLLEDDYSRSYDAYADKLQIIANGNSIPSLKLIYNNNVTTASFEDFDAYSNLNLTNKNTFMQAFEIYTSLFTDKIHAFELKNDGTGTLTFSLDGDEIEFSNPITDDLVVRAIGGNRTFLEIDDINVTVGYSNIVAAPVATNVSVSGDNYIGKTLNVSYVYSDANADFESGTTVQWFRADDVSSAGTKITEPIDVTAVGALTYKLSYLDYSKYIYAVITPKNTVDGAGEAVESNRVIVDKNDPIKYKWNMDDDNWINADTTKGGAVNSLIIPNDKDWTAENGNLVLTDALDVAAPIRLNHNEAWTVRIKGQLRQIPTYPSNWQEGMQGTGINNYASFFRISKAGEKTTWQDTLVNIDANNYVQIPEVSIDAAVNNGTKIKASVDGLKAYESVDISNIDDMHKGWHVYESILADKQHIFELKNVLVGGEYKLYFVVDGDAVEFNGPLTTDLTLYAFSGCDTFSAIDYINVAVNSIDEKNFDASLNGNTITVNEVNYSDSSIARVIYAALFNTKGVLKEIRQLTPNEDDSSEFLSNTSHTISFSNTIESSDIVKCFVLDNSSSLKPITEVLYPTDN